MSMIDWNPWKTLIYEWKTSIGTNNDQQELTKATFANLSEIFSQNDFTKSLMEVLQVDKSKLISRPDTDTLNAVVTIEKPKRVTFTPFVYI